MARNTTDNSTSEFNKIVVGTKIHGEVETQGDIRIDGGIVGTMNIQGKLVLGPKGTIEGEIKCKNAEILGSITGEITVTELLSLKASAKIKGDIITNKISIEPGATLTGTINMENDPSGHKIGQANAQEKSPAK
ncbi:MAG: polymer-forming cytoskeletal protein [Bacteroidales bacterium]|nr:polymer-forming cytoskeletal protein [Bacteroidales bacterium]